MNDVDVVAAADRLLRHADPAAVWALVADPERVAEWAPVRFTGWMGTRVPEVGQAFFVARRGEALRAEIVEWEAGHRYRCRIEGSRWVPTMWLEVRVESEVDAGHPAARLALRYRAECPRWRRVVVRRRAAGLLRRAIVGVERVVAASGR